MNTSALLKQHFFQTIKIQIPKNIAIFFCGLFFLRTKKRIFVVHHRIYYQKT